MKVSSQHLDSVNLPSQTSTKYSGLQHPDLTDSLLTEGTGQSLLKSSSMKMQFGFGSQMLAVIYMANTMVIPEMNQVQNEVSFASVRLFIITITQYLSLLLCICIPSYMMIRQCETSNSPFYNQVIAEVSPRLGRLFLQANMTINILALFNLVIRLIEFTMNSAPCMYKPIAKIMASSTDSRFFIVWFIYYLTALLIHYGLFKISYFENFNQLQGRLVLTFVSKWTLFLMIFAIIGIKQKCDVEYLPPAESLIQSFELRPLLVYYTNVIYCLSFPFIEIFYIKRETQSHSRSSFGNVKRVYKMQLLLRSSFFLLQISGWGLLYNIHKEQTLNCNQQLDTQMIMMTLTTLTIITAAPIYANNYSLNMQVMKGEFMDSGEQTHKKLIAEAYAVSAFLMSLLFIMVIALRLVTGKFWDYRTAIINGTQGLQGFCFGLGCVVIPLLIQSRRTESKLGRNVLIALSVIALLVFTMILADPWVEAYFI